jgi:hypothetical protein
MKMRFVVVVGAVLVAAAIVAVVVYSGGEQSSSRQPASAVSAEDRIKVEIRAMPVATITVDGKNVGKTPMSLQYPRSSREITVEATLVRHLVKRDAKKDEVYKGVRKIPLTQDHLLDFTFENTELVETKREVIERAPPPAP